LVEIGEDFHDQMPDGEGQGALDDAWIRSINGDH
jgi:hypothetical protein